MDTVEVVPLARLDILFADTKLLEVDSLFEKTRMRRIKLHSSSLVSDDFCLSEPEVVKKRLLPKTPEISLEHCLVSVNSAHTADKCHLASPDFSSNYFLPAQKIQPHDLRLFEFRVFKCQNTSCNQGLRLAISQKFIHSTIAVKCPLCSETSIFQPSEDNRLDKLTQPAVEELTEWLSESLAIPIVISFSLAIGLPERQGKSYDKTRQQDRSSRTNFATNETKCRHGIPISWCSVCKPRKKKENKTQLPEFNIFDFILPTLQPPLGDDFDSLLAFPSELYPFQRVGVKFLGKNPVALLADEMGLGKSIQTIAALKFLTRTGDITSGIILCPKSLLTDWEKKLSEWAPEITVLKVRGNREQRKQQWESLAHIYLTTYETLRQDLPDTDYSWLDKIAKKNFDVAILDEIQKIKNPSAELTQSVRRIEADRRWGLSGTPLENRAEELIAVFAFLKPKLLRYDDAHEPIVIKEKIRPYFLRRRKADVLTDLPEKNCDEVWLELSDSQKKAYERAEKDGIVDLDNRGETVTVQHVLALITKLKQICNFDPATGKSCKLEYLSDKLDSIADQGDKALIFSQYTEKTLAFLEPRLKQFNPHVYHGILSDSKRDQIIDDFQNRNDCKILLMSVKAGGLGLTLTRANFVFHFDLWWNPAVAAQAEDRAHRIGQKKTVYVTSLFTRNTIEEEIQKILKRKKALFSQIVDDLSDTNLSMSLSEDELFGLFGLQKPTRRYFGR